MFCLDLSACQAPYCEVYNVFLHSIPLEVLLEVLVHLCACQIYWVCCLMSLSYDLFPYLLNIQNTQPSFHIHHAIFPFWKFRSQSCFILSFSAAMSMLDSWYLLISSIIEGLTLRFASTPLIDSTISKCSGSSYLASMATIAFVLLLLRVLATWLAPGDSLWPSHSPWSILVTTSISCSAPFVWRSTWGFCGWYRSHISQHIGSASISWRWTLPQPILSHESDSSAQMALVP